jgi:hypothetical protein
MLKLRNFSQLRILLYFYRILNEVLQIIIDLGTLDVDTHIYLM